MTFQPDSSQLKALKTWYPVDNPLHLNPRHAVIKLAGEAGEILDLFGKHEYKPNFDWFDCKNCKRSKHEGPCHPYAPFSFYTPLILDELGDWWYYFRILTYQREISLEEWVIDWQSDFYPTVENCVIRLYLFCSKILLGFYGDGVWGNKISDELLYATFDEFMILLRELKCPLSDLTDLNYKKLNSEPTNHGWKNAKMKTIADCPPMNPK